MAKYGFYYNQDDCVGCKACQVACKDKNELPIGITFRYVRDFETGSFPDASIYHYARTCNHCANPACVENCPTGAMWVDAEDGGVVKHDDYMCIGCQICVNSCPYGNPQFFPELKITGKCDACSQLRAAGEPPACVAACQMRALEFGDVEELAAKHPDAVFDLAPLPDSSITTPCTFIDAKPAALTGDYVEVYL